jgi:hypothetical protein
VYQPDVDRNNPVEVRQAWQRQKEADKQLETCLGTLHLEKIPLGKGPDEYGKLQELDVCMQPYRRVNMNGCNGC